MQSLLCMISLTQKKKKRIPTLISQHSDPKNDLILITFTIKFLLISFRPASCSDYITMDSNNSNITTTSIGSDTDHFFPTSTHFFDPLGQQQPTFLDDSPTSCSSWPPQQQTNCSSSSIGAETTKTGGPTSSRPSKKRSRASRRAPTTVLTTDTSNFRAMVQEFTGIPAPPFANSNYSPCSSSSSTYNNNNNINSQLHFPRSISMFFNPPLPPPPSSLLINKPPGGPFTTNNCAFQPPTSDLPINFQSILNSQLLINLPQPAAAAPPAVITAVPHSSGELSLPGVIIGRQQQQQMMDPTAATAAAAVVAEFRNEKGSEAGGTRGGGAGDGLLESWMCSSD